MSAAWASWWMISESSASRLRARYTWEGSSTRVLWGLIKTPPEVERGASAAPAWSWA